MAKAWQYVYCQLFKHQSDAHRIDWGETKKVLGGSPCKRQSAAGSIAAIYKSLHIVNKSIALLCQITSKKLQIIFVQNAETLID